MVALTTNTAASALDMATEIFGSGFTISSATYSGSAASSGTFSDGDATHPTILPSDAGVILSTGNVDGFANAGGGNNNGGTSSGTSTNDGVAQFDAAAGQNTFDAAYLEIEFTPEPGQTTLNIEFRFYSEEYNEYVYSNFNDIALVQVDGTTIPLSVGSGEISVNSINDAANFNPANGSEADDPNPGNGTFDSANPNLYIDNSTGAFDTEFDGFTVTLSMDIPVTPGVTQTLLIGIADVGDSSFDSSLVIASNNVPDVVDTDPIAVDDTGIDTFGVNPKTVDILANDTDPTGQTLTITEINGTAVTSGSTVTLATGQTITLNANGTITLVNAGGATGSTVFSYTVADTDGNTDSAFVTFDAAPICFTDGMMIDTPFGPRCIEDLHVGDMVLTRDSGPQVIRWHGARSMAAVGEAAPIEIAAGLLGNARAIRVSPQHRILCAGYRAQLYFGHEEVLVAAKNLVNGSTVRQHSGGDVRYHHILFDRHEIVTCDGVDSESYHPGSYSLLGLDAKSREELFALFPALRSDLSCFGQAARFSVKGSQGHMLAA